MSVDPGTESSIEIDRDFDIVTARQRGRELAASVGFTRTDQTLIATAISEVARNILVHAQRGKVVLRLIEADGRRGIVVEARDQGPGIADVELALRDGYSTTKSLGLGLPGSRRMMDDLTIESVLGRGTTVTMKRWVR